MRLIADDGTDDGKGAGNMTNTNSRHRTRLASVVALASAVVITAAVLWGVCSRNAWPPQRGASLEERAPIELTREKPRIRIANRVNRPVPPALAPYYERYGFGKPVLCCPTH
jgi:hypothetical protein